MNIQRLMQNFGKLNQAAIGQGAKHPTSPDPAKVGLVSEFLDKYPFLRRDQGYVDFLERYAGASVDYSDGSLIIHIFGFIEEVSLHLVNDEPFTGPLIKDGFFMFCSTVAKSPTAKNTPPARGALWPKRGVQAETPRMFGINGVSPAFAIDDEIGLDYAFDATGRRLRGVYQLISHSQRESETYEWYCGSFLEWLEELIDKKGQLFDRLAHHSSVSLASLPSAPPRASKVTAPLPAVEQLAP